MQPWRMIDNGAWAPGDLILWDDRWSGERRIVRSRPAGRPGWVVYRVTRSGGELLRGADMRCSDLRRWLEQQDERVQVFRRSS